MDDLLSEFLTETSESLEVLDSELIQLEQNPNDPNLIGNIFRVLHTVKGTCGFLGLPRLEKVAHAGESILTKFRDGDMEVTPEAVSLILEAMDCIKALVQGLGQTGTEPEGSDDELIGRLHAMAEGKAAPAAEAAPEPAAAEEEAEAEAEAAPEPEDAPEPAPAAAAPAGPLFDRVGGASGVDAAVDLLYRKILADADLKPFFEGVDIDRLQGMQREFMTVALGGHGSYTGADLTKAHAHLVEKGLNGGHFDKVAGHLKSSLEELEIPADAIAEMMTIVGTTRDAILGTAAAEEAAVKEKPKAKPKAKAAPAEDAKGTEGDGAGGGQVSGVQQTLRVNVDVLENLMTVVSELVLTRNQLLQILRSQKESEFAAPLQRLNHVTSELQESVMQTRMQPIGNAWGMLPRLVRDLSRELGKKINLQMVGAETELDRQVLESIRDPLTHMIRNSGDHGLETPEERIAAGKPETGTITVSAHHEGGHIILSIADDGRGLSTEKIKAKALQNGLATEAELETLSDQQIHQFIFRAGFSTAQALTNVSGRGVGMDVVRTNISKIGGTVEMVSTEGKGSKFIIKIPLTLAIVSALILECCDQRFAMPQNSVIELVRTTSSSGHSIEKINGTPVLRLRNRLLPLVSLKTLLGLGGADEEPGEGAESYIVVSQVGTYTFGIMVDRVFDTEEIVVKPVASILRDLSLFAGNTILGDGSVIMILDPNGIAAATGEISLSDEDSAEEAAKAEAEGEGLRSLLVFKAGEGAPMAVPLSVVARLEEIDLAKVERANGQYAVQYRGHLMPLIPIDGSSAFEESGRRPVLVFSDGPRTMGLVTDEIVDIVESRLDIEMTHGRAGILGSAIIGERATDILDAGHYVTQAFGDWFEANQASEGEEPREVLLVDDSAFFRNLVEPLLVSAGYTVTSVPDASTAMELLESGAQFDAIISDIEMPGMSGYEFASQLRSSPKWESTPLFALSSHSGAEDQERGRQAGFTDYIPKSDRGRLLSILSQVASNDRSAA